MKRKATVIKVKTENVRGRNAKQPTTGFSGRTVGTALKKSPTH